MLTIHKYTVPVDNARHRVDIPLPGDVTGARLVATPGNFATGERAKAEVVFWAIVDTDNGPSSRTFTVVGTGHQLPIDIAGVETAHNLHESGVVMHLVETHFASDPTRPES